MANIKDRPYVGTWSLDGRKLVQHTPDALIYVNGSVTLPRCRSCDGRINLQKFVTEVSVESGTDPNGASASFTLAIPLHSSDAFARDAKFLLHPGLEVHIYERGYFPVKGLFSNLAEPLSTGEIDSTLPVPNATPNGFTKDKPDPIKPKKGKSNSTYQPKDLLEFDVKLEDLSPDERRNLEKLGENVGVIHRYFEQLGEQGFLEDYNGGMHIAAPGGMAKPKETGGHVEKSQHYHGNAIDMRPTYLNSAGQRVKMDRTTVWAGVMKLRSSGAIHPGGVGAYVQADLNTGATPGSMNPEDYTPTNNWTSSVHYDTRGYKTNWYHYNHPALTKSIQSKKTERPAAFDAELKRLPGVGKKGVAAPPGGQDGDVGEAEKLSSNAQQLTTLKTKVSPSLLERFGLSGTGVEDVAAYPYYQTFHGVVIQVSHSWSGGFQTITVQCASMLHFWQYHKISTNIGITTQVDNAGLTRNIKGHKMVGWHPYQIIYHLHKMTFGNQMKVGDVLSKQDTNQDAVDPGSGRGLGVNKRGSPSLMQAYWERRFNDSIVGLRLHGMSGQLYSSIQAAYLSSANSSDITKSLRKHFGYKQDTSKLGGVQGLNLGNDRTMRGFTFSDSSLAGPTPSRKAAFSGRGASRGDLKVNMMEISAFVWNLGETANWGLFENTYTSKLDLAQKVMEVTGFEFFQDVDGDLVFKPPMWNLDTSGSRVYRIEDIDIINLSFDEKEPQCTYTIVKSSQMSPNGINIGLTGETGKKATYVDYRLVAKFGYRPFEFETTYLPDQRSMFYMGVARMDVINIATNSASVSIPLRPEMRPGYPVYIPYLDCYYYVRSMSHSYSVGGQCTTTLQLVGKRAKFYAPGLPDGQGIDAIDFADTTLPQRPLEVQGKDGVPRLAGFPNVVMALDPEGINPMYYPAGADLTRLETDRDMRNLLRMASREGMGILATQGDGLYTFNTPKGYDTDGEPITEPVTFYFGADVKAKASGQKKGVGAAKAIPEGAIDIRKAAKQYRKFRAKANKSITQGKGKSKTTTTVAAANAEKEVKKLDKQLEALVKQRSAAIAKADAAEIAMGTAKAVNDLDLKRDALRKQRADWLAAKGNPTQLAILGSSASPGVKLIYQLLDKFAERFWVASDQKTFEELTTHHIAQLLGNKKANFSNNSQPGAYRYYSASHPDPAEQGQPLITYRTPSGGGVDLLTQTQMLDDDWADITVQGFVRTPDTVPGTYAPEAKLEDMRPVRGMLVQTHHKGGLGEVRPTSEIRTVMQATQIVEGNKKAGDYKNTRSATLSSAALRPGISGKFIVKAVGKKPLETDSFKTYFETTAWKDVWDILWTGVLLSNRRFDAYNTAGSYTFQPPIFGLAFPDAVSFAGSEVPTKKAANLYAFGSRTGEKVKGLGNAESLSLDNWFDLGGFDLSEKLLKAVDKGLALWVRTMDMAIAADTMSQEGVDIILTAMADHYAAKFGVPISVGEGSKQVSKANHKTTTWSSVFPVSDASGYEVVGSFQYGRGLDIEPGGVWDAIRAQDPLSILDRKTLHDIASGILRGKTITVEVEKTLPGGKKVKAKMPLRGATARGALERNVLKSLRKNYSDQQLLDFGLLVPTKGDPNKLKFNLMNWVTTQKEGVHKLPVVNAAFSLADLTATQDGKVCACKAAEANTKIEAFGNAGFLSFASGGDQHPTGYGTGDTDRASQWLINQAMLAASPHKMQQDAMRGVALDKPKFASFDEFKSSFVEPATRLADSTAANAQRVADFKKAATEEAEASFEKVRNVGEDEES